MSFSLDICEILCKGRCHNIKKSAREFYVNWSVTFFALSSNRRDIKKSLFNVVATVGGYF